MTIKHDSDKIYPTGKENNPKRKRGERMTPKWKSNYPNIAAEIDNNGLKIEFVAKSVGLTYRNLYGRLTNEIEFELPVMRKLSEKFGKSLDYLFNDKKIS